jgi:hypothetical protein
VLQENSEGYRRKLREMIEEAGLEIAFLESAPKSRTPYLRIYYVGIARQGDLVLAWAKGAVCS